MISATVITAATPSLLKSGTARTTFIGIAVNIETGHISVITDHDRREVEKHFTDRGDPPMWRGLQIIRVDAQ